jgi:DNA-binding NarL/FixJ family response regulator
VQNGRTFFSQTISRRQVRLRPQLTNSVGDRQNAKILPTAREMEVLQLVAEGLANKQTASKLGISIKTVEKHRGRLMQKLDIHDTAGLTRYAISAGIIECSVQSTITESGDSD